MEQASNSSPLPAQQKQSPSSSQTQLGNDDIHDSSGTNSGGNDTRRRTPPTPEELVAHYEAQGLEYKDASLRVIQELQGILYQTALSGRRKKDKFMSDTLRKLDNVNTRLAIVESKLDGKPGFIEAISIGLAAGAAVSGLSQIWSAVSSASQGHDGHPPSS